MITACDGNNQNVVDQATAEGQARGATISTSINNTFPSMDSPSQIATAGGIIVQMDDAIIMQSQLVLSLTTDSDVVAFANTMIDEHSANRANALALMQANGVAPRDSQASLAMRDQANTAFNDINSSDEPDFMYLQVQVIEHQQNVVVLNTLNNQVNQIDTKNFVRDTQALEQGHLNVAIDLLRNF